MKLSIIIPALNEENYIERTLQSIKDSDFDDYEIIVVANGCTDNTSEKSKIADTIIVLDEKGVSKARNKGAEHAKGEILVFLDADTTIEKDTLQKIAGLQKPFIGTCYGQPNNKKIMAKIFYLVKNRYTWTGNSNGIIIVDKEVFNKVKGFDENFSRGEDWRFMRQAKKHAKFKTIGLVTNDMRRYEKLGYLSTIFYMARTRFYKYNNYPPIR